MILLRAFPFSFAILWRYALVFPFLLIALAVFGFIAFFVLLILSLVSPALMLMLVIGFGVAFSVLPSMVGMRLGLQAKGVKCRNSFVGLFLPAVLYGFFEGFCALIIVALGVGAYLLATPLSLEEITQMARLDQDVLFARLMAVDPVVTLSLIWVGSVMMIGLRAALLVPFAGASIGADPDGQIHTPFYGFGSGFLSLLLLVAISYIGSVFVIPVAIALFYALGYGDTVLLALAELETAQGLDAFSVLGVETVAFAVLCAILFLWVFSLQCAGAVLVFMQHKKELAAAQNEFDKEMDAQLDTYEKPMPQQDMMDLVRSRMQNKNR